MLQNPCTQICPGWCHTLVNTYLILIVWESELFGMFNMSFHKSVHSHSSYRMYVIGPVKQTASKYELPMSLCHYVSLGLFMYPKHVGLCESQNPVLPGMYAIQLIKGTHIKCSGLTRKSASMNASQVSICDVTSPWLVKSNTTSCLELCRGVHGSPCISASQGT